MEIEHRFESHPFFSICIPQYNRTSFLIETCRSLSIQTFRQFEVCISDDCSTDRREAELIAFLQNSGMAFVYRKQERNSRYDGNIRAAIGLARGRYCFLLGNDDALASVETLARVYADLEHSAPVAVAMTNYEDFVTGSLMRRIRAPDSQGSGPVVAAQHFRSFSFVSGVLFERERAQALATERWDGSEMYQMYIGCRLIAEGGTLLGIGRSEVRKDIQIPGELVDSLSRRPRLKPCPIVERQLPLTQLCRLVIDAITPVLEPADRRVLAEQVLRQFLLFTYPFWLFEYRHIQSWRYAAGICLGMRPRHIAYGVDLGLLRRIRIVALFAIMSLLGLSIPVTLFERYRVRLYNLAKAYHVRRTLDLSGRAQKQIGR